MSRVPPHAARAAPGSGGLGATAPRPRLPAAPFLVVGLGRAGMAAAEALVPRVGPAAVRVWDEVADSAQRDRAEALRAKGVEVVLGGDGTELLEGARTIVKSPGVPPEIPVVARAAAAGIPILDELAIGWRLLPVPVVGITGTNGKSTVSSLCVSLLAAHGLDPVLCGNTDFGPPLSELARGPLPRSLVAEISSYQLEYGGGFLVDGAVFTNLTVDHLNRHGTMAAYGAAKRRLFLAGERAVPVAALNADDPLGAELADEVEAGGGRALRYGFGVRADYRVERCRWGLRSASLTVSTPGGSEELTSRLPGAHNAANATAVLALADGLGLPRDATLAAIAATPPVPGRFEVVDVDLPFDVVVDLSVSAASVAAVLAAARELVRPRRGRLLSVVGLPGRAGPLNGREIGATARELSDHAVFSGASYRGEPRLVTLAALAAGARAGRGGTFDLVIDRRQAIQQALEMARPGDLVAIVGRGPISREAVDGRGGFVDLDDREVVKAFA